MKLDGEKMTTSMIKKKATQYQDFAHSKQSFNELRMIEAINGNIVLRGRLGRPDMIFPINKAWKRFWNFYRTLRYWRANGLNTQCVELTQVIELLGHKIQLAIGQRLMGVDDVPQWFTPKASAQLSKALQTLKITK